MTLLDPFDGRLALSVQDGTLGTWGARIADDSMLRWRYLVIFGVHQLPMPYRLPTDQIETHA